MKDKSPRIEELVKDVKATSLPEDKPLHWRVLLAQIKKMKKGRKILLRRDLYNYYVPERLKTEQKWRIDKIITDALKTLIDNGYVKEGFGVTSEGRAGVCLVLLREPVKADPEEIKSDKLDLEKL